MDLPKNVAAVYLLLFLCILYIIFTSDLNNTKSLLNLGSFHKNSPTMTSKGNTSTMVHKDVLGKALSRAAKINETLIISIVNKAYVEGDKSMLDLFLDGFWLGEGTRDLTNCLLIVAMDRISYQRCKFLRLHCYKLETEGVDFGGEKMFMSQDFIKMMWARTSFLRDVLKRGYSFIFTDVDVLWLRNPFPYLAIARTQDLQFSTDNFNGNEMSKANPINTGFYMVRSNNKTIALFDSWYESKNRSSKLKEQDVLQILIHEGFLEKLGLKVKFLDTVYFSGFCQDSRNVTAVATVHANCCRSVAAKLADLTAVVHDWKRFKSSPTNETITFRWSIHKACWNSWRHS